MLQEEHLYWYGHVEACGSGFLGHGLNFSTAWCIVRQISVKKDWKHVIMQKVVTVNTCCDIACQTFQLLHITTGSFQSLWWQPTTGSLHSLQHLKERDKPSHTHPFNCSLSGTTWVSQYQKVKTNRDFTEARDSKWQWHHLGHLQVCTSLQTDNHASTPPLSFHRPDALPAAQPTASKHWRQQTLCEMKKVLQFTS